MAKDPYMERLREMLAEFRSGDALLPEFMADLAADEAAVVYGLLEHRGDLAAIQRANANLLVQEVASLCNRPRVQSAALALKLLLDASFDEVLGTLRGPFFKAVFDGLHSTKDRTRIEFARMAANLFEKQQSRLAKERAAQRELEGGGDAAVSQLAKGLDGLTDEQLAGIIAEATATLH